MGERIEGWRGPWKLTGKRVCGGWESIIHAGHWKTNDYWGLAGNNYWGLSVDDNKLQNSALSKGGNHSSVAANSCLVGMQYQGFQIFLIFQEKSEFPIKKFLYFLGIGAN